MRATIWRAFLRLRFLLWQRRRHETLVLERILGIPLVVLPGVFNPTLFRITPVLLDYLRKRPPDQPGAILDLGTGTGVLAVAAAEFGHRVVATDIDPEAVRCARINVLLNDLAERVDVRQGDLFEAVSGERFDLVVANPPYYSGEPSSRAERAFRAGDFPQRFAEGLGDHLQPDGTALVVLSSDGIADLFIGCLEGEGFRVDIAASRDLISEVATVYRVTRLRTASGEPRDPA